MKYNVFVPIEARNVDLNSKIPKYTIRGYALASNIPHIHQAHQSKDGKLLKKFKSMFTDNFQRSMLNQLKHQNIFIDTDHQVAGAMNVRGFLNRIKDKVKGVDISAEEDAILKNVRMTQTPMFKPKGFEIDDKGLMLEVEGNPYFRDESPEHAKYFDNKWGQIEDGWLNGMSINFSPTKTIKRIVDGEEMDVIDEGEVYGVSITSNAALADHTNIFEVAVRATQNTVEGDDPKMDKENVEKVKQTPVEDVEKLKADLAAKEKELSDFKTEKEKSEWDRLKADNEAKEKELEALKKERQGLPQPKGIVIDDANNRVENPDKVIKENVDNLNLGHLIQLQGEFNLNQNLPRETRIALEKDRDLSGSGRPDIVVNK